MRSVSRIVRAAGFAAMALFAEGAATSAQSKELLKGEWLILENESGFGFYPKGEDDFFPVSFYCSEDKTVSITFRTKDPRHENRGMDATIKLGTTEVSYGGVFDSDYEIYVTTTARDPVFGLLRQGKPIEFFTSFESYVLWPEGLAESVNAFLKACR